MSRVDGDIDGVLGILGSYVSSEGAPAQKALRNVLGADFGALRGPLLAPNRQI